MKDWLKISRHDVKRQGGAVLFQYYMSMPKMLQRIYPNHTWRSEDFVASGKAPRGYWEDTDNLLRALQRAEEKIGIQKVVRVILS